MNGIDSEMQRLQIGNNKNSKDDEDALLEAAINLAATEREELEAAATNDEANNSEKCVHGLVRLPSNHVCSAFMNSFYEDFNAIICESNPLPHELFGQIFEATKTKYAEVWNDSEKVQWVASRLIINGTNMILEGDYSSTAAESARLSAMSSCFFEQWATIVVHENETQSCNWDQFSCIWGTFAALCDWTKMCELYVGDEHTIVSFFRKRIQCKCLDSKYEEVKSISKIGFCCYKECSLPDNKTERSKMLCCTQCRNANYCSRECQVAHWPFHKEFCIIDANRLAARKSRQKK